MQHTTHIMPRDASPILIRRIGATQSGAGGGAVVAAAHGDERTLSVRSSTCCLRCNCCECDWATAPPAREPVAYRSYARHSRPTDRPGIPASHQNRKFEIAPILYSPAEPAGRRSARRTEATFTIFRPTDSLLPFYPDTQYSKTTIFHRRAARARKGAGGAEKSAEIAERAAHFEISDVKEEGAVERGREN